MVDKLDALLQMNYITALVALIIVVSLILGFNRGATASARQLFQLVVQGAMTIIVLFLAWKLTAQLSPKLHEWLVTLELVIPNEKLGALKQLYYTFVTGIRDFSLLRFACIFIPAYLVLRALLDFALLMITRRTGVNREQESLSKPRTITSGVIGMIIGSTLGVARAFILVAILFVYATLQPQSSLSLYAQESSVYQKGANQILAPFSEEFISNQVPVFTRAVELEFQNILQRKYDVIDQHIPTDIAGAASEIVKNKHTDEDKARALYDWVGTRIIYDHEKVRRYEEDEFWMEQSPEDTFNTRKGVCIDYARLYAMMARSINLDVKVITGLGYDGRGGYGPHAWNEVYISDNNEWIPLDSTWASSGANWFNPDKFEETHIEDT